MQFIDSDCEVYTYKTQSNSSLKSVRFCIENSHIVKILYCYGGCAFDSRKIVMNRTVSNWVKNKIKIKF